MLKGYIEGNNIYIYINIDAICVCLKMGKNPKLQYLRHGL